MAAPSVHPIGRDDIIEDIGYHQYHSQETKTIRRVYCVDLVWLRDEFGADITCQDGSYVLGAIPGEWVDAIIEWRQQRGWRERTPGPPEFLVTRPKAQQLSMSEYNVRALVKSDILPARKMAGRWYFDA